MIRSTLVANIQVLLFILRENSNASILDEFVYLKILARNFDMIMTYFNRWVKKQIVHYICFARNIDYDIQFLHVIYHVSYIYIYF